VLSCKAFANLWKRHEVQVGSCFCHMSGASWVDLHLTTTHSFLPRTVPLGSQVATRLRAHVGCDARPQGSCGEAAGVC
jgi:hypothetical protein